MEENNENITVNENHEHHHHPEKGECPICGSHVMRHIITGLLVFLGAFMAFYTLGDLYMKTMFNPMHQMHQQMNKMDREFMREQQRMNRDISRNFDSMNKMSLAENNVVNLRQSDDNYQIMIDLKPFDNNEKNVNITVSGQTLTINGAGISSSKHGEKMVKFSQSYMFGKNVKLSNLTKRQEGNLLVVTIPIED